MYIPPITKYIMLIGDESIQNTVYHSPKQTGLQLTAETMPIKSIIRRGSCGQLVNYSKSHFYLIVAIFYLKQIQLVLNTPFLITNKTL